MGFEALKVEVLELTCEDVQFEGVEFRGQGLGPLAYEEFSGTPQTWLANCYCDQKANTYTNYMDSTFNKAPASCKQICGSRREESDRSPSCGAVAIVMIVLVANMQKQKNGLIGSLVKPSWTHKASSPTSNSNLRPPTHSPESLQKPEATRSSTTVLQAFATSLP